MLEGCKHLGERDGLFRFQSHPTQNTRNIIGRHYPQTPRFNIQEVPSGYELIFVGFCLPDEKNTHLLHFPDLKNI